MFLLVLHKESWKHISSHSHQQLSRIQLLPIVQDAPVFSNPNHFRDLKKMTLFYNQTNKPGQHSHARIGVGSVEPIDALRPNNPTNNSTSHSYSFFQSRHQKPVLPGIKLPVLNLLIPHEVHPTKSSLAADAFSVEVCALVHFIHLPLLDYIII